MDWTIAALSSEVSAAAPFAASVGVHEIALFRDAEGVCRAVEDRCAHRRAPLSAGKVTAGGLIECPYHGWRYEGVGGACKAIPNLSREERVPGTYRIRAYSCAERDGFVWVAGGEADRSVLPTGGDLPELPAGMVREGAHLVAYPAHLYRAALIEAPSAALAVTGHRVIDHHRLGEPQVGVHERRVQYAVDRLRRLDPDKPGLATADFPFMLEIRSSGACDSVALHGEGRRIASLVLAAIPVARGVCRVIWRACHDKAAPVGLVLREHLDAPALFQAERAAAPVDAPQAEEEMVERISA